MSAEPRESNFPFVKLALEQLQDQYGLTDLEAANIYLDRAADLLLKEHKSALSTMYSLVGWTHDVLPLLVQREHKLNGVRVQ